MKRRVPLFPLLLTFTLFACKGPDRPDPLGPRATGSIAGIVTIDGEPAPGIVVTLELGQKTVTGADGSYSFTNLPVGEYYSVMVTGYPDDVEFRFPIQIALLNKKDEVVWVDFSGTRVALGTIEGTVTIDGAPAPGFTVIASGPIADGPRLLSAVTDVAGKYSIAEVPPATYSVYVLEPPPGVEFLEPLKIVDVARGEVKFVPFIGRRLRGVITGRVGVRSASGGEEPLADVSVQITHVTETDMLYATTDAAGLYAFDGIREGKWTIQIGGWDEETIGFDETTAEVEITEENPSVSHEFWGFYRPGTVRGTVTLDGAPAAGAAVRILAADLIEYPTATDGSGAYVFESVPAGAATVSVALDGDPECEAHPRLVIVPPAGEVVADFTCTTPPPPEPVSFSMSDVDRAPGPVGMLTAVFTFARLPDNTVVGPVEVQTGSGGNYFLEPDKLFADYPGFLVVRPIGFDWNVYSRAAVRLSNLSGVGPQCQILLALIDEFFLPFAPVTSHSFGESLEIELTANARGLRIGFFPVTPGACQGAYFALRGGTFQP